VTYLLKRYGWTRRASRIPVERLRDSREITLKPLRLLLAVVALAVCSDLVAKTPTSKNKKEKPPSGKLPSFETVTRTVQKQLASGRSYRPGDLITTSAVDYIFRRLEKLKWKVADRKDILKLVLSDSDWMARQFSSEQGREFMREIADLPGGYDRVDRLRRMPYGEQQIANLIRSPDGYKLFEYMTTTQGGRNLGGMLSQGVNGRDFNSPTGRIYTETDLLKRLKKSYDIETVRRLSLENDSKPKGESASTANGPSTAPTTKQQPVATPKGSTPRQPPVTTDDPFEKI
jgi:hypothetical protein